MIKQIMSSCDCLYKCNDFCCRFSEEKYLPRFTNEEYKAVIKNRKFKKYFKKIENNLWLIKSITKEGNYLLCPFVKKKVSCQIYEKRPFECWIWPFFVIKKDKKLFLAYDDEECYGIQKRKSNQEIKKYIAYICKKLQGKCFVELFKKYPHLIWEYNKEFRILYRLDILHEELYGKDN